MEKRDGRSELLFCDFTALVLLRLLLLRLLRGRRLEAPEGAGEVLRSGQAARRVRACLLLQRRALAEVPTPSIS